ncbi:MAG: hypothetical protein M3Y72_26105 [Acidobacteriota bacterium]|nr:hypothetical protein [Acidobacteriota bacterium]
MTTSARLRKAFAVFALLAFAIWAGYNWISTIRGIFDLYVCIPTWDYWRVAAHVKDIRLLHFRYLWEQHNDHRIVFPDLVFALDVLLLYGRRILPLVVSFFCYFGSWSLLGYVIWREKSISPRLRTLMVLVAGAVIGWKGCTLVLADPFLLQWTLGEFATLLALLLATYVGRSNPRWALAGAIAAGVVATYSSANGLLIWPVLLLAGYLLRASRTQLLVLAVSGLAAGGLYFVGYRFSHNANWADLILHPCYTLQFVAVYLSMPFGGMKSPRFGVYVGFSNLAVMALLAVIAGRVGLLRKPAGVVLFGSYVFIAFTALLTAAGRMEPGDTTFTSARAARYLGPVMINWGAAVFALLWIAAVQRWRILQAQVLAMLVVLLFSVASLKLRWWLQTGDREFVNQQITELSIENGVLDPRLLRFIFPDTSLVERYLPELKADKLSIYYKDPGKLLGSSVNQHGTALPTHSDGAVTTVFPVISGFEVIGWAADIPGSTLLVSDREKIIGFGRRIPLGLPSQLLTASTPSRLAWIAFASDEFAGRNFSLGMRSLRTQSIAKLSGSYSLPRVTQVTKDDQEHAIGRVTWTRDAVWTANGIPNDKLKGQTPDGVIYGSWSGSDSNAGRIISSLIGVPVSHCIVIPVLHGHSSAGLGVEIRDGRTGEVLERVPMQDEDVQWEFWRILVGTAHASVRITAWDEGTGSGQWLALGQPAECR